MQMTPIVALLVNTNAQGIPFAAKHETLLNLPHYARSVFKEVVGLHEFAQQIVSGLATGSIFASVALALVLIYRSMGVINFAQGEMAMFTTFIAWQLIQMGMPVWAAFATTSVIAFLGAVARERTGKPYGYAYGVDAAGRDGWSAFDALVKIDVRGRSVATWRAPGAYPGEPLFVGRPGATDEDDGVLLSVVLDTNEAASYLLVLDARTLEERARAIAPHAIPFGFHGLFR